MKEYYIKSILTGSVTLIVAKNLYSAIKKGREYFSEPNRNKAPVRVLN